MRKISAERVQTASFLGVIPLSPSAILIFFHVIMNDIFKARWHYIIVIISFLKICNQSIDLLSLKTEFFNMYWAWLLRSESILIRTEHQFGYSTTELQEPWNKVHMLLFVNLLLFRELRIVVVCSFFAIVLVTIKNNYIFEVEYCKVESSRGSAIC